MPATVINDIVTNCTNLELLTLAGLQNIDDSIAFALSRNCPNAQHISFRNCQLTDDGVCEMAINCSKLTMVALAGIGNLTDKCIIALAENCHQIRELYVSGCAKITRQAILYLKVSPHTCMSEVSTFLVRKVDALGRRSNDQCSRCKEMVLVLLYVIPSVKNSGLSRLQICRVIPIVNEQWICRV